MTSDVVAVRPDVPTADIAKLLLNHRIRACPVIDENDAPIGMVSEWDLIFMLLAKGDPVSDQLIARNHRPRRTAKDVMGGPMIMVTEETEASEIARIMIQYRVSRVVVVRDGRLVGIVSRTDMLRALVQEQPSAPIS